MHRIAHTIGTVQCTEWFGNKIFVINFRSTLYNYWLMSVILQSQLQFVLLPVVLIMKHQDKPWIHYQCQYTDCCGYCYHVSIHNTYTHLIVEVDLHKLSKTTAIVVPHCLGITKRLQ